MISISIRIVPNWNEKKKTRSRTQNTISDHCERRIDGLENEKNEMKSNG